jgi:adenosylcobinamide-GDP ribazoletransferase
LKSFFTAFSVLTVLPLNRRAGASEKDLARSVLFFPLVGFLIGGVLMVMTQWLLPILSPGVLAAVILLTTIVITGGLHLDGLADLCDGLAAGGSRDRMLSVMKDSHVGAFGVMGLVIVLILKYSLFFEVMTKGRLNSFLMMGLLSRWAMVLGMTFGRYARENGTAKPFIGQVSWQRCIAATAIVIGFSWWVLTGPGLLIVLLVLLSVLVFNQFLKSRVGGWTGDALGALNEVTEVVVLLCIVAVVPFMESR